MPGGECLECIHPFDPDYELKVRAARWGVDGDVIRQWTNANVPVTAEIIETLARTQNQGPDYYAELDGVPFTAIPALTECGENTDADGRAEPGRGASRCHDAGRDDPRLRDRKALLGPAAAGELART